MKPRSRLIGGLSFAVPHPKRRVQRRRVRRLFAALAKRIRQRYDSREIPSDRETSRRRRAALWALVGSMRVIK